MSDWLEKPVTILTTDFDPDTDVSVERMRAAGLIGDRLTVKNLFQDAGVYGGDPTAFFSRSDRAPAVPPTTLPLDDTASAISEGTDVAGRRQRVGRDASGRVTSTESYDFAGRLRAVELFAAESGQLTGRDYLDESGRRRVTYRRDPAGVRWLICFLDEEGVTRRLFSSMTAMRSEWLEGYSADHAESIVQVESENYTIVRAVLDMDAPGAAKVMMMHSSHLDYPHVFGSPTMPEHEPVLKRLDEFDAFVLITPTHRDDIAMEFGPRDTLHAVPHDAPTALADVASETDSKLAVGVGRFAERKNWDHAIRAFKDVHRRVPDARLELWGRGPLQADYEALIGELGLQECVRVMGPTDDPESVFRRAGFSVLAGIREGFSLVLLESLSCGTPVVVYDGKYGPNDMLRDGIDGILVPYGDIAAFSDAMVEMFTTPDRQLSMGRAALEIGTRFSAEKCVRGWLHVYVSALEQRDHRVRFQDLSCTVVGLGFSGAETEIRGILDVGELADEPTVRLYIRERSTIVGARYLQVETAASEPGRIAFMAGFDTRFIADSGGKWDAYVSVTLRNAHRFVRIAVGDRIKVTGSGPVSMIMTSAGNLSLSRTPERHRLFMRAVKRRARLVKKKAGVAKRHVTGRVRYALERAAVVVREVRRYLTCGPLRLRARYVRAFNRLQIDPTLIVVETVLDDAVRGNMRALVLRMLEDPAYAKYSFEWVIRGQARLRELQREFGGARLRFVRRDSADHVSALTRAGHIFTNGSLPAFYQHKAGQVVLNTWHGVPIKKMGFAIPDGRVEARNVMRVLLQCDYLVSGSVYESERLYLDSHRLDGLYRGTILETGHPRLDLTMAASREGQLEQLRAAGLDVGADAKTVLYAPTWRGESVLDPTNTTEDIAQFALSLRDALVGTNFKLLLRFHPLTARHLGVDDRLRGMLVPDEIDTNELLAACDVLVTDYSSIFVDFMVTGRPIVFYVDDVAGYIAERGVYLQPAELPGPLATDAASTADRIVRSDPDRQEYAERYDELRRLLLPLEDGAATRRVLSAVFEDDKAVLAHSGFDTRKTRLLLHSGTLKGGRRARSVLALLRRIDTDRFDVSVLAPYHPDEAQRRVLRMMPAHVRTFLRSRGNYTLRERIRLATWLQTPSWAAKPGAVPVDLLSRTWSHLFGPCRFDIAVDLASSSMLHAGLIACGDIGCSVIVGGSGAAELWRSDDAAAPRFSAVVSPHDAPYARMVDCEIVSSEAAACEVRMIDGRRTLVLSGGTAEPGDEQHVVLPDSADRTFVVACRGLAGQLLVLRAFERLLEGHPHAHLLFLNPKRTERRLAGLIGASIAGERVRIVHSRNELALIAQCGCLVAPALRGEVSILSLEAAALGIATIVGDAPALHDVFAGTGRLVASEEAAMERAMSAFVAGSLRQRPVDFEKHNRRALEAFYRMCDESCATAPSEPAAASQ